MRRSLLAFTVAAVVPLALAHAACAAADISVKTTYYPISGTTGETLIKAMDRKGPKHGFLTRAIAQTKYSMTSGAVWMHEKGACRAVNPVVKLDVTYIYPKVESSVSLPVKLRWTRFMAGVQRHERNHGRIAAQMASAASKAITRMRFVDSPDCSKSRNRLKQEVNAIIHAYERKQIAFDDVEHKPGGNVDGLLRGLRKIGG